MRRYGDPIQKGLTYRRRPGAYGLIVKGRQVLLALTEDEDEALMFPGGGIDPSESPIQALHREVMEETGWRIAVKRRLGFYHRQVFMSDYGYAAHKVCHIYLCEAGRQVADPIEPDHTPVFADLEAAQKLLSLEAERNFVRLLR